MLLMVHNLRPQILKYLLWRQERATASSASNVRIYADPKELKEMELCHPRCLEILDTMHKKLGHFPRLRALDVAGGDGRLTQSLLVEQYLVTDLFDQCPQAIEKAKLALHGSIRKGYLEVASMQTFRWKFKYSGIYLVWCAGYLDDSQLVSFLRVAKTHLITDAGPLRRRSQPKSFIFVLDNLLNDYELSVPVKN